MLKILVFVITCCQITSSWASNELRELEYAEEIKASLSVGEIIWLKAKEKDFLTLYTETEDEESLGTAILLHAKDAHPDQKIIINPLRTYLPKHKWATLSLQMPVLSVGATSDEYYLLFNDANARIQAAVDYLVSAKVENIVLIGYGLGGMMATYYLNENADKKAIKALVAISLAIPKTDRKQAKIIGFISRIKQPFLDIFAEFDSPEITRNARQKRVAGKTNSAYRQFKVKGEAHLFQYDEGLVVKRIYSWINRTFR